MAATTTTTTTAAVEAAAQSNAYGDKYNNKRSILFSAKVVFTLIFVKSIKIGRFGIIFVDFHQFCAIGDHSSGIGIQILQKTGHGMYVKISLH